MYDHLIQKHRIFFEGMSDPVFYAWDYPIGCRNDVDRKRMRYAQGLKADKDPNRCFFCEYQRLYERHLSDLLKAFKRDFPRKKRGVVVVPSSKSGKTSRVTELTRCALRHPLIGIDDLTECLIRTKSKATAHEGGRRSIAENVASLEFNEPGKLEKYDVILVIDDILTTGNSFRAVGELLRGRRFRGFLVNFAFAKTVPADASLMNWTDCLARRARCIDDTLFDAIVFDLDQTLIDDAVRDDEYEAALWQRSPDRSNACPYHIYPGIDDLMAHKIPFAIVSNRPERELEALFAEPSIANPILRDGQRGEGWYETRNAALAEKGVFSFPKDDDGDYVIKCYKPSPKGVEKALSWLSRRASKSITEIKAVGIGNTLEDLEAYRAAGIASALALWGIPEYCRGYASDNWGADYVFSSVLSFRQWCKKHLRSESVPQVRRIKVPSEMLGFSTHSGVSADVQAENSQQSFARQTCELATLRDCSEITCSEKQVIWLTEERLDAHSEIEYEQAVISGDDRAAYGFAQAIQDVDVFQAISLYKLAIAAGDEVRATRSLADLCEEQGCVLEYVEKLYKQAIAAGDELYATNNLGNLIFPYDPERAEALYERAIAAGNEWRAAANLAMLIELDDPERARSLYEQAVAAGGGVWVRDCLDQLVEGSGDSGRAYGLYLASETTSSPVPSRFLLERAVAAGNDRLCPYECAKSRGFDNLEQLSSLYRRAIAAGNRSYAIFLLARLDESDNPDRASFLYERAIAAGETYASPVRLADLLKSESRAKATDLYQQAIDAGNVSAYAKLARLVSDDDRGRAIELCEKAVAEGDTDDAPFFLAWLLEGSDVERSKELYQMCVDHGNCYSAANNLALLVQSDDPDWAKSLFERAIAAGDERWATNNLGWLIRKDDPERAKSLYERAIAAGDEYWATRNLANLVKSGDPDRAKSLLEHSISAGNVADAADDLALLVEPDDPEEAKSLYEQSVAAGNERWAANHLANLIRGDDPERAKGLYERAIAAGDEYYATNNLGCLIYVDDPEGAIDLFQRAIAAGDEECATCNYAHMLVASDSERAKSLYERALAANGDAESMLGLAYLLRSSDSTRSADLVAKAKMSEGLMEAVAFVKEAYSAISPVCAAEMEQFLSREGII